MTYFADLRAQAWTSSLALYTALITTEPTAKTYWLCTAFVLTNACCFPWTLNYYPPKDRMNWLSRLAWALYFSGATVVAWQHGAWSGEVILDCMVFITKRCDELEAMGEIGPTGELGPPGTYKCSARAAVMIAAVMMGGLLLLMFWGVSLGLMGVQVLVLVFGSPEELYDLGKDYDPVERRRQQQAQNSYGARWASARRKEEEEDEKEQQVLEDLREMKRQKMDRRRWRRLRAEREERLMLEEQLGVEGPETLFAWRTKMRPRPRRQKIVEVT